jgi:hypothetical protein
MSAKPIPQPQAQPQPKQQQKPQKKQPSTPAPATSKTKAKTPSKKPKKTTRVFTGPMPSSYSGIGSRQRKWVSQGSKSQGNLQRFPVGARASGGRRPAHWTPTLIKQRVVSSKARKSNKTPYKATRQLVRLTPPGNPMANDWRHLTDKEELEYLDVEIPRKGPIGIDYDGYLALNDDNEKITGKIWWDYALDYGATPPPKKVADTYLEHSHMGTRRGLLFELRDAFIQNRKNVIRGRDPTNFLIQGPPGTGKTRGVKAFCAETGLPYWYINGDPDMMGKEELLGRFKQETDPETGEQEWVWHDGKIPKAARYGGVLMIDEFTLLPPEVQMILHPLLDAERKVDLTNQNGEIIRAHPDLFIVASCNPSEFAQGVDDISEPVRSRFARKLFMDYPPLDAEMKIVKMSLELTDDELEIPEDPTYDTAGGEYGPEIQKFLKTVREMRGMRRSGQLNYVPTIREAVAYTDMVMSGRTPSEALHMTVV